MRFYKKCLVIHLSRYLSTLLFLLLFFFLVRFEFARASSCCAGVAQFPAILTTDSRGQFSIGGKSQWTVGDVDINGRVTSRTVDNFEEVRGFNFTGVYIWKDLYQVALQIPLQSRLVRSGSVKKWASDLGEVALMGTHEFLPEYSYSVWKPRGFVYLKGIFPSGKSIYDGSEMAFSSLSGQGFHATTLGLALIKNNGNWDWNMHTELKYLWPRRFYLNEAHVKATPDLQYSGSFGGGYSFSSSLWHMGISLGFYHMGGMALSGNLPSSRMREVWDTQISLSRLIEEDWTVAFNYRDQTLWGPARNTPLAREIVISTQKRWPL